MERAKLEINQKSWKSVLPRLASIFLCLICFPFPAYPMIFGTEPSLVNNEVNVIVGRGAIEEGDADRFKAAILAHPPDAPVLMVTSPGGEVAAAYELAKLVRSSSFSIIAHKECASACAMILFPAGEYSILTKGSVLGIHSCSTSGARNELCNEEIAHFAVSNGFPYGTLDMFSDLYGPGQMKWMTEIAARCFGFYRSSGDPKPIHGPRKPCVDGVIFTTKSDVQLRPFGPSFNCENASTRVERLFCIDKELMQSDSILGLVYDAALKSTDTQGRARLRSKQRQWIKGRNADCRRLFTTSMGFMDTREAALCLYKYNENRIYSLIDTTF